MTQNEFNQLILLATDVYINRKNRRKVTSQEKYLEEAKKLYESASIPAEAKTALKIYEDSALAAEGSLKKLREQMVIELNNAFGTTYEFNSTVKFNPPEEPADVVIVGGGPIGYAQALGFKKLNPELRVVVLEKYDEFKRKHTLVMQYKQLAKLMKETNTEDEPRLKNLLAQLKKSPNIRTNVLQQTFKELAEFKDDNEDLGALTILEEVDTETINEQLERYQPKLIVGADGTHSVVSKGLFPLDNQVKHEVDFALQLRFEINGSDEKSLEHTIDFYQRLARNGLVATEQVGRPDENGKTPVTVQIIIPKEDYIALREYATAKKPIKPFSDEHHRHLLPKHLKGFIEEYLAERIKLLSDKKTISPASISISVNELPATQARQVMTNKGQTLISLNGDAALGLSYFKGLNAGLEALAQYFKFMKPAIEAGLNNPFDIDKGLLAYQAWFTPFASKKVAEVQQYSLQRIKSATKLVKVTRGIKGISRFEPPTEKDTILDTYFRYLNHGEQSDRIEWNPYPHRSYDPDIKLGQFAYVPMTYSLKKIGKLFVDFFKPYKGSYQVKQDFQEPFVGVVNVGMGLVKLLIGLITFNFKRAGDGVFSLLRGIIEIAMTPLVWFVKPLIRGAVSLFSSSKKIETNHGIQKLVQMGEHLLEEEENSYSVIREKELLGICNDLHRKFLKAKALGQETTINPEIEVNEINQITTNRESPINYQQFAGYFSLFGGKQREVEETTDDLRDTLIL